jgi:GH15 family glucan-1,4-alpha-glucosidase
MPPRDASPDIIRMVEGVRGEMLMRMELVIPFDYGSVVPWVRKIGDVLCATAGPDSLYLHTPVDTHGEGLTTVAEFVVSRGARIPFVLTWNPSHLPVMVPAEPERALAETQAWWIDWSGRCTYKGPYRDQVVRSLITLRALTYAHRWHRGRSHHVTARGGGRRGRDESLSRIAAQSLGSPILSRATTGR